jgi:hypothetical protein
MRGKFQPLSAVATADTGAILPEFLARACSAAFPLSQPQFSQNFSREHALQHFHFRSQLGWSGSESSPRFVRTGATQHDRR